VLRATDFPKTHDIGKLMALMPAALWPRLTPEEQRRLTGYAAAARYPGSSEIATAEVLMDPWNQVATTRKEVREGGPPRVVRGVRSIGRALPSRVRNSAGEGFSHARRPIRNCSPRCCKSFTSSIRAVQRAVEESEL
jgi:hypothetical protein